MDFGYCREREVVFYVGGEMVVGREEKRKTMKEQRKTMTIKKKFVTLKGNIRTKGYFFKNLVLDLKKKTVEAPHQTTNQTNKHNKPSPLQQNKMENLDYRYKDGG